MGKLSKVLGVLFIALAIVCFGMYFLYRNKTSDHKVVFDSDGGSIVAEQIIKAGGKAVKPDDPTKEKNDFVEWQLDGKTYNFDNVVESDITLKAIWNAYNTFSVKVTLDDKEYTLDAREGQPLNIDSLNLPAKEGYEIKLYDESGKEYDKTTNVTADLTLTAKYKLIETYTVKYDSNGGSKVSDVKVNEGETLTMPTSTRDGYTLEGWYLGTEKFDFTTPITKNITLKAKWNENGKVNVIFMVDGSVYKTIAVKENSKVTKPSNPTKKGYRFVEWQLNNVTFDFNTKITEETTLTAVFEEAKSYTVSFNSDGGSKVSSQEVEAGSKAKKPTDPTKSGYIFKEWQLNGKTYDFNKEVTDDLALKAVWEKESIKYTIKFNDYDGREISKQTVVEGNKITKPADPSREGYKFVEWLLNNKKFDFSTVISSEFYKNNKDKDSDSITLTARYEKNAVDAGDVVGE